MFDMVHKLRGGGIKTWALVLSLGLHVILLSVFGVVKFSKIGVSKSRPLTASAFISPKEKPLEVSPIIPKPKVKKIERTREVVKRVMDIPKRGRLRSPDELIGMAKIIKPSAEMSISDSYTYDAKVEFFGQRTDMRKVCYVVDCSGSMAGIFSQVRGELRKSITKLEADQYFYIILFRGDGLLESGRGKLVRATESAKTKALGFIDSAKPAGPTNALAGLNRSMQIKGPGGESVGLIYFLTDGFDLQVGDTAEFADMLEDMRKKLTPVTRINTIGFWTEEADCAILASVAEQSGGEFVNIK